MADTQLAYFAGLFDGEGHVGIRVGYGSRHGRAWSLRCTVGMTSASAIKALHERFGGSVRLVRRAKGQPLWEWHVKAAHAELAIAFRRQIALRKGKRPSADEVAFRESYRLAIKALNHAPVPA